MTNEAPTEPVEPAQPVVTTQGEQPVVAKKGAARFVTPILALVAALVIGLFGGVLIGHATSTTNASARGNFGQGAGGFRQGAEGGTAQGGTAQGGTGNGAPGAGRTGGFAGGNFTSGKVISNSGGKLVIQETDGTKVTITTTGKTTVTKTTTSSVDSLTAGETITVIGTKSGSSVAATRITAGTVGGFGGFRPGAQGTAPAN